MGERVKEEIATVGVFSISFQEYIFLTTNNKKKELFLSRNENCANSKKKLQIIQFQLFVQKTQNTVLYAPFGLIIIFIWQCTLLLGSIIYSSLLSFIIEIFSCLFTSNFCLKAIALQNRVIVPVTVSALVVGSKHRHCFTYTLLALSHVADFGQITMQ
jgi:hypothetical protein